MGFGSSREVGPPPPPGFNSPRGPHPMSIHKANYDCRKPLTLSMPTNYGSRHGHEGIEVRRRPQNKSHLFFERWRLNGPILAKAIIGFLVPPLVFFWVITLLTFHAHFLHPAGVWFAVMLGAIPGFIMLWSFFRNRRLGLDNRWSIANTTLFALAFLAGILVGDINYLLNMHHFYFNHSLKSYSNVKPKEMTGMQLEDAGRVVFAEGTRLQVEMGMSFTMWDTYCVAPITSSGEGAKAGPTLASYDIWAVGKNCCSSDNPAFACGEYANIKARSGLRQTDEDERLYYALAVQQAEAAYSIEAKQPIFFHWVEDADAAMQKFYSKGFQLWVFLIFMHFTVNAFAVVIIMNILKYHNMALFKEPEVAGSYLLKASPHAHPHAHAGHGHAMAMPDPHEI